VAVLNSKIYTGKENNEVQKDLERKAVTSVLQPYPDKGSYAFMDNYYTSVALFRVKRKKNPCIWHSSVQQGSLAKRDLWCEQNESDKS